MLSQIRREQPQAATPFLSPFLSLRLVLEIWCQLIKQSRSLQPGFSVFNILIIIFLGHIILCLIHRMKSSLVLHSSLESLDLKHLTWLPLPLLDSIVCEQNICQTLPYFWISHPWWKCNSWEFKGSVIKIQIMDSTILIFKYIFTFLFVFQSKIIAFMQQALKERTLL